MNPVSNHVRFFTHVSSVPIAEFQRMNQLANMPNLEIQRMTHPQVPNLSNVDLQQRMTQIPNIPNVELQRMGQITNIPNVEYQRMNAATSMPNIDPQRMPQFANIPNIEQQRVLQFANIQTVENTQRMAQASNFQAVEPQRVAQAASVQNEPPKAAQASNTQTIEQQIYQWINELSNPCTREKALLELSKRREAVPDLAPLLWNSFGTITILLQEIMDIYPLISPPVLSPKQSNRVCNALALLQCVASHPETRAYFLQGNFPLYLYPFLHTSSKEDPFEYLRLTSLGVIGAMVKNDDQQVISFLLSTEIIPLCLKIMETGTELSKTVATFILQKILMDEVGLTYICQSYERFTHVTAILRKMVLALVNDPSARLLKHVIRCYLRLTDNESARNLLRGSLPVNLRDNTFSECLKDDVNATNWLNQLLKNLDVVQNPIAHNLSTMANQ